MVKKMPLKRKEISMAEYNRIMASMIKKGAPVADTLIEMLEESSKYTIKGIKRTKRGKKGK